MTTPGGIVEVQTLLKKSGQVKLDSSGNGVLTFDTDSARTRWEVTGVVTTTNQASTASVVPIVTLAINSTAYGTMSPGNQRGGDTWSGNQDSWSGQIDIGPCDFLSVIFRPPTGQGASLSGVIASVVVTGRRFTRRA